ncbi:MAG: energy-coupling factor ABC transporter ATP-binding protein [Desulforhopalus sp.]
MLYKLDGVQRIHNGRTVLNIDALEIRPNLVYTLIGPNGAGKTSLLKILSFLDRPSGGEFHFQGRRVSYGENQLHRLRRKVVLLDQNPIMFTGSVWKNVEFGLKVRRVGEPERRRRVDEALEMVGMENFATYHAPGLSGGETKRVALARALVLQPEVLLCDEPTANVDNENQEIILQILKQINQERSSSIIFSTHYLSQAQQLADHTLLLQYGALSTGMNENTFRVVVSESREDTVICKLTGQLMIALPQALLPEKKESVKLHIDPAAIVLGDEVNGSMDGNRLTGHIVELVQDNGRVRVTVETGVRLVVTLPVTQYRAQRPCIGDKVNLFIPHSAISCSSSGFNH